MTIDFCCAMSHRQSGHICKLQQNVSNCKAIRIMTRFVKKLQHLKYNAVNAHIELSEKYWGKFTATTI